MILFHLVICHLVVIFFNEGLLAFYLACIKGQDLWIVWFKYRTSIIICIAFFLDLKGGLGCLFNTPLSFSLLQDLYNSFLDLSDLLWEGDDFILTFHAVTAIYVISPTPTPIPTPKRKRKRNRKMSFGFYPSTTVLSRWVGQNFLQKKKKKDGLVKML